MNQALRHVPVFWIQRLIAQLDSIESIIGAQRPRVTIEQSLSETVPFAPMATWFNGMHAAGNIRRFQSTPEEPKFCNTETGFDAAFTKPGTL